MFNESLQNDSCTPRRRVAVKTKTLCKNLETQCKYVSDEMGLIPG